MHVMCGNCYSNFKEDNHCNIIVLDKLRRCCLCPGGNAVSSAPCTVQNERSVAPGATMEVQGTTSATTVATVAMAAVSASIPTVAPAAVHTTVSKHLPCMALAHHAYIMCGSLHLLNLATSVCVTVRRLLL